MLILLVLILTTLGISLVSTPLARKIALRFNICASPNNRTVHKKPIPKLGGLSIFLAFAIGLIAHSYLTNDYKTLAALLVGGGFVLCVGLLDDIFHLSCYRKLIGQTIAAIVAVYFGFSINSFYLPAGLSIELGYWGGALSVLWIVSITNAVNLLDGLDGLAAGFTIVVALFILFAAVIFHNFEIAAIALILVAASVGFLKYNFSPAKIFMGDMGSLFLGFVLACLSLKTFTLLDSGTHLSALLVLFLIPLADTLLAILRRMVSGQSPFTADKKHIHHRLLGLGLSQTGAVLIVYSATFICGVLSLVLYVAGIRLALIILGGILLLTMMALVQLGSFDFLTRKEYSKKLS